MANKMNLAEDETRGGHPPLAYDFDLEQVRSAVRGIRYGEVRVVIQDGVIIQIERVERQRLR